MPAKKKPAKKPAKPAKKKQERRPNKLIKSDAAFQAFGRQRRIEQDIARALSMPLTPDHTPDAADSWTPERELTYLNERLALAREGLAKAKNEVYAGEALVHTYETRLAELQGHR